MVDLGLEPKPQDAQSSAVCVTSVHLPGLGGRGSGNPEGTEGTEPPVLGTLQTLGAGALLVAWAHAAWVQRSAPALGKPQGFGLLPPRICSSAPWATVRTT